MRHDQLEHAAGDRVLELGHGRTDAHAGQHDLGRPGKQAQPQHRVGQQRAALFV